MSARHVSLGRKAGKWPWVLAGFSLVVALVVDACGRSGGGVGVAGSLPPYVAGLLYSGSVQQGGSERFGSSAVALQSRLKTTRKAETGD